MRASIEEFMPKNRSYDVVDFGSFLAREGPNHRDLLADHDCRILGVDLVEGRNVDLVMDKPYRIPLPSNSADVILTGQVFEHIPFFFTSMIELRRVLKPGGYLLMTVPSRGHQHNVYDCWRFYPDAMRAMAAFSMLKLEKATTDFPPKDDRRRLDYSRSRSYWGDTVGVFRKPPRSPRVRLAVVGAVLRWWSNAHADLDRHPIP